MVAAIAIAGVLAATPRVFAAARANAKAGKEKVRLVCQACHGMDGISLVRTYPNLRGQKELYIIKQLEAFRSGERKSVEMNPTAEQLTDQEILDVAAYYSRLK